MILGYLPIKHHFVSPEATFRGRLDFAGKVES